ncbi:hypothetical protein M2232_006699 [Bradyrhizobium japonicum]|uniref:hypothetical protein n=1 Tax=Bradyrhizobium japonicum TaxID=375 RepID=UPI0022274CD9|nr:hypothetical protein [Bradyrhizobium japonicum]MCW2223167.1 hypothetical protein [Bradyrhizobium japonicum]MCW2347779.1 hypothetical protein [Bradyrhizobium japonicum]
MLIKLTNQLLQIPFWHPVLDVIYMVAEKSGGRHSFEPGSIDLLARSEWARSRPALTDVLKGLAKSSFQTLASDAITLMVDNIRDGECEVDAQQKTIKASPYDAIIILTSPLHILVENETSDGAFLLWMARLLGERIFREAYNENRITFRQVGGKGEMFKSAKALSQGVWQTNKNGRRPFQLRAIAVLDSDARFPNDQPNLQIKLETASFVAHVHVLNRRSIENYLSAPFMRRRLARLGNMSGADAFFRMSLDQRKYFPVKDGFRSSARPPVGQSLAEFGADQGRHQSERDLFSTIDPRDWDVLKDGFGTRLADVFFDAQHRCSPSDVHQFDTDIKDECKSLIQTIIRHM